jgi:hypothetical protein
MAHDGEDGGERPEHQKGEPQPPGAPIALGDRGRLPPTSNPASTKNATVGAHRNAVATPLEEAAFPVRCRWKNLAMAWRSQIDHSQPSAIAPAATATAATSRPEKT